MSYRSHLRRIHSVLAMRLIEPPVKSLFGKEGRQWLDRLNEKQIDRDGLDMVESDLRQIDALQLAIDRFDQRLAELAYEDERVKLLMTMPGVSVIVAQALVAAFGDITRFPTADKAASYLGLVPSTKQSAKTCHHGPITKRGDLPASGVNRGITKAYRIDTDQNVSRETICLVFQSFHIAPRSAIGTKSEASRHRKKQASKKQTGPVPVSPPFPPRLTSMAFFVSPVTHFS